MWWNLDVNRRKAIPSSTSLLASWCKRARGQDGKMARWQRALLGRLRDVYHVWSMSLYRVQFGRLGVYLIRLWSKPRISYFARTAVLELKIIKGRVPQYARLYRVLHPFCHANKAGARLTSFRTTLSFPRYLSIYSVLYKKLAFANLVIGVEVYYDSLSQCYVFGRRTTY